MADYNQDELAPVGSDAHTILQSQDEITRAIAFDNGSYRAIVSSAFFSSIADGEAGTKAELMAKYIAFLLDEPGPKIYADNTEMDYGLQYLGYPATKYITIKNTGINDLFIGYIDLNGQHFSYSGPTSLTLASLDEYTLEIEFDANQAGNFTGQLNISSTAVNNNHLTIPLIARCIDPPILQANVGSIALTLDQEQFHEEIFTLSNTGNSDLIYNISLAQPGGQPGQGSEYQWMDSSMPDGPEFLFDDISAYTEAAGPWNAVSSILPEKDEGYLGPIELQFDFPFYDCFYSEIYISSNGYIYFDPQTPVLPENVPIPSSTHPNGFIAPFWDDLTGHNTGDVYISCNASRAVIQYSGWKVYGNSEQMEFQIHLLINGSIFFYYNSVSSNTGSGTTGIEDQGGQQGICIAYNQPYIQNGFAVRLIKSFCWADINPTEGTIAPDADCDISLMLNSSLLNPNTYAADICISSNSPSSPVVTIPVEMTVLGNSISTQYGIKKAKYSRVFNYPNPFNPETVIAYSLPEESYVKLKIFNIRGELIDVLVDEIKEIGSHRALWNGHDANGNPCSSGIYFYKVETESEDITGKMVLLK